jgi:hypothetical protein
MPCCVTLIALAAPRIALFLVWILSDYLGRAYETVWVPLLGFLFLPTTTLAYAWAINTRGEVRGFGLAVVVLAALVDLGALGSSRRRKRERSKD